jgi:hypothetical protein
MATANLARKAKGQANGRRGIRRPDHEGVADRLDFLGFVVGQELSHLRAERLYEIRGPLIPMSLGQRREPGEIREQKRLRLGHRRRS